MLRIRVDAPSATITLDRPKQRNALSRAMVRDLIQAFNDLHNELKVRGVILTGAGDDFCSGQDLNEIRQTHQSEEPWPQWHEDGQQYRELLLTMLRFPKPILAAVNGSALASGAGLVLASDIAIATDESRIGFPEIHRGLAGGMMAPLLTFRIGGSWAARLLLTGDPVDAKEAKSMGVYQEIVAHDLLWARAHELCQRGAETSPQATSLTKRMLNETVGEYLEQQLTLGAAVTATSRTTEAAREGVAAFLEKRKPEW